MNIWREGKYLDLWSVNHFLSGVVFAGWMFVLGSNLLVTFILYLAISMGWEIFEIFHKVKEDIGNKMIDVAIGVMGFFLIYILNADGSFNLYSLIAVTIIYISMEMHGYFTYER